MEGLRGLELFSNLPVRFHIKRFVIFSLQELIRETRQSHPYESLVLKVLIGDLQKRERVLDYFQIMLEDVAYACKIKWSNLL